MGILKTRIMKNYLSSLAIALITITLISCDSDGFKQTESGLQYKYNKKGDGQKVEKGSFVKTKLSLMIEDSVVWTSYQAPDSLFSFVVGYSGVIQGFEEMALLMQEGDDVYVAIPDSLAYGDQGAGGVIPPNATVVYDRYEMVSVSEPKLILSDSLIAAYQNGGDESMFAFFDELNSSGDINNYHTQLQLVEPLLSQIFQSQQMATLEGLIKRFDTEIWEGDQNMLSYYSIVAIQAQGRSDVAIAMAKDLLANNPGEEWVQNLIGQLEAQKAQADQQ